MAIENYSNFTRTRQNKGFYQPDQPENHRKEREEGKGARAGEKKKKTNNSQVFILWTLEILFLRQK